METVTNKCVDCKVALTEENIKWNFNRCDKCDKWYCYIMMLQKRNYDSAMDKMRLVFTTL